MKKKLNREEMIQALVQENYNWITSNSEINDGWIWDILECGFDGFQNRSDEQLEEDYEELQKSEDDDD
jgi:hypothetical protein